MCALWHPALGRWKAFLSRGFGLCGRRERLIVSRADRRSMHSCCTLTHTQCQYLSQSRITQMRLPEPLSGQTLMPQSAGSVSEGRALTGVRRTCQGSAGVVPLAQRWCLHQRREQKTSLEQPFQALKLLCLIFSQKTSGSITVELWISKWKKKINLRCPEMIFHRLIHTTCPTIQRVYLKCFNINRMSGFAEKSFIPSTVFLPRDDLRANKHYGKHWRAKKLT